MQFIQCACVRECVRAPREKNMRDSKIKSKSINSYQYYLHILQLFSFLLKCSKQSCLVGLHMNVNLLKPIRQTFIFFFVISPLQHSCFELFLLLFNFLILKTLQYIRDCTTEFWYALHQSHTCTLLYMLYMLPAQNFLVQVNEASGCTFILSKM